jgi:hypothetical protein
VPFSVDEAHGMETELAQRENDGITVTLLWQRDADTLTVRVHDGRSGDSFDLAAQAPDAMDIFHHPYAYAATRGVFDAVASEPLAA